jgi:hypothetical protein
MAKGKKTGGRRPGSPNKSTQAYKDTLASMGFNPAEEAIKMFLSDTTPIDIKMKLLTLLTEHSTFKPKAPVEDAAPQPTTEDQLPNDTATLLSLINPTK